MKSALILLLGVVIWSGSLIWPEVNLLLTPSVALALIAGLIALLSLSVVLGRLWQGRRPACCDEPGCDNFHEGNRQPIPLQLLSR